jgi:hypothetical protein
MQSIYSSELWSIKLLPGWSAREDKESVTIVAQRGVGALQISAWHKSNATIADTDIDHFASEAPGTSMHAILGGFLGRTVIHEVDGRYWQKWWIAQRSLMLFISYNCRVSDKSSELNDVHRMLDTLRSKVTVAAG